MPASQFSVNKRLPVTTLSGLLRASKTTLLNHILNNRAGRRVGIIVNDMSKVNIDADLVGDAADLSHSDEKLVEMTNDCTCRFLRDDLLVESAVDFRDADGESLSNANDRPEGGIH